MGADSGIVVANPAPPENSPNPLQIYGELAVPLPIQLLQLPVVPFDKAAVQLGGLAEKLPAGQFMVTLPVTDDAVSTLDVMALGEVTGTPAESVWKAEH